MYKLTVDVSGIAKRLEKKKNRIVTNLLVAVKESVKPIEAYWVRTIPRGTKPVDRLRLFQTFKSTTRRWSNGRGVYSINKSSSRLAHIIERGTKPRYTRAGHYRGKGPPFYTMRDAVTLLANTVTNGIRTKLLVNDDT